MKYFLIFSLLFSASVSADNLELCNQVRDDSYSIMMYRQRSMDRDVQLKSLRGLAMNDVATRLVIIMAYGEESFQTGEYRELASKRFAYKIFRDCLKNAKHYAR